MDEVFRGAAFRLEERVDRHTNPQVTGLSNVQRLKRAVLKNARCRRKALNFAVYDPHAGSPQLIHTAAIVSQARYDFLVPCISGVPLPFV